MTNSNRPLFGMSIKRLLAAVLLQLLMAPGVVPGRAADGLPSARDYYPLVVGNSWTYAVRERGHTSSTLKWKITQQESIRGKDVFHVWSEPSDGDEPLDLCSDVKGILECDSDRYLIRNGCGKGQRWSAHLRKPEARSSLIQFEVKSGPADCVVAGHEFRQCVEIEESDMANQIVSVTTYARSIGPVKYVYSRLGSKTANSTVTIRSWRVSVGNSGIGREFPKQRTPLNMAGSTVQRR